MVADAAARDDRVIDGLTVLELPRAARVPLKEDADDLRPLQ